MKTLFKTLALTFLVTLTVACEKDETIYEDPTPLEVVEPTDTTSTVDPVDTTGTDSTDVDTTDSTDVTRPTKYTYDFDNDFILNDYHLKHMVGDTIEVINTGSERRSFSIRTEDGDLIESRPSIDTGEVIYSYVIKENDNYVVFAVQVSSSLDWYGFFYITVL
jgi:hypothetical protein